MSLTTPAKSETWNWQSMYKIPADSLDDLCRYKIIADFMQFWTELKLKEWKSSSSARRYCRVSCREGKMTFLLSQLGVVKIWGWKTLGCSRHTFFIEDDEFSAALWWMCRKRSARIWCASASRSSWLTGFTSITTAPRRAPLSNSAVLKNLPPTFSRWTLQFKFNPSTLGLDLFSWTMSSALTEAYFYFAAFVLSEEPPPDLWNGDARIPRVQAGGAHLRCRPFEREHDPREYQPRWTWYCFFSHWWAGAHLFSCSARLLRKFCFVYFVQVKSCFYKLKIPTMRLFRSRRCELIFWKFCFAGAAGARILVEEFVGLP